MPIAEAALESSSVDHYPGGVGSEDFETTEAVATAGSPCFGRAMFRVEDFVGAVAVVADEKKDRYQEETNRTWKGGSKAWRSKKIPYLTARIPS